MANFMIGFVDKVCLSHDQAKFGIVSYICINSGRAYNKQVYYFKRCLLVQEMSVRYR